jgi:hypothetical protein
MQQPQPTPMTWAAEKVPMQDGTVMIALQVASCTGVHVTFVSAADALKISERLADLSREARSGIQIAQPGQVPPVPPNGNGSVFGR